jgi:hypothetical protein
VTTRASTVRLAGLVLPLVLTAARCGPSPASATPVISAAPAEARPSAAATTTADSAPSATAPSSPGRASTAPEPSAVTVDATLLHVLPATIDGVALEPDPTTASQIAVDPSLADTAQAIGVALAIRPGTSGGDDLAVASVIRLRPGVFSEAWFETWRRTYDEGACEVAGGVQGPPSQTSIAGRTVYVGTCAGDAHTYHVHLADPTLIVSVTAAGPDRFGELVVAGLAE